MFRFTISDTTGSAALIHLSFGLLSIPAYGYDVMTSALLLAGPLANYAFLRTVGGDKQTEQSQAERYAKEDSEKYDEFQQYQTTVNSFWPGE